MKSTGIVRKVDELGRVVVPMELRRVHGIGPGTPLEIYTEGDTIMLRPYLAGCMVCGQTQDVRQRQGKRVCGACLTAMLNTPPLGSA